MGRRSNGVWVALAVVFGLLQGWATSTSHPPTALKILGIIWSAFTLLVVLALLVGVTRSSQERRSQGVPVTAGWRGSASTAAISALVAVVALVLVAELLTRVL